MEIAKGGFVYMMASLNHSALYTGVTADLTSRVMDHREKVDPKSFTARYNCIKLVYFEFFDSIEDAIDEEKRIKGGSRKKKETLIEAMNPGWKDLWQEEVQHW